MLKSTVLEAIKKKMSGQNREKSKQPQLQHLPVYNTRRVTRERELEMAKLAQREARSGELQVDTSSNLEALNFEMN